MMKPIFNSEKLTQMDYEVELKGAYRLIKNLTEEIDYKNHKLSEMQLEHDETNGCVRRTVVALMEKLEGKSRDLMELETMYEDSCEHVRCLIDEKVDLHEKYGKEIGRLNSANLELMCDVQWQSKELENSKARNGKLLDEIKQLKANLEVQSPPDTMASLNVEITELRKQLKEKKDALLHMESLNHTLISKELTHKQELEDARKDSVNLKEHLEIHSSKANSEVQSPSPDTMGSSDVEISELRNELKEKEEALLNMESLNRTLIRKELITNQELQDARKESVNGLQVMLNKRTTLGIKRMGELDHKAFRDTCSHKFSNQEDWEAISANLCSIWEENLKDPHWHPFKMENVQGQLQEIVNGDDEKLKALRNEYGEAVYEAVANALLELNEYNASGRYPIPVVWNLKDSRRAIMKEIVQYIIKQLKNHKRKRRC